MVNSNTTDKIKICHISTVHPASDVRVFYRECCSLAKAGYEVHLIIQAEKPSIKNGVHIHPVRSAKNRALRMLITPWAAMINALRIKASIYHYHDPELIFMGFVLRWIFGKKVVFDIHESVIRQLTSKDYLPRFARKPISLCYKFIERIFITGQALVLANQNSVSDYSRKTYLVQNYPLLNEKILASASDRKQRSKVPLLIYVGALAKIRGSLLAVDLAANLLERGYDFQMKLIGQCTEAFNNEIKTKIKKLTLEDKVILTGRMEWLEAMELVSKATIGLCLLLPTPNYTTCLATKIIEYMMCGTPVLCSKFEHWRPYVEGEKTGMMVNPADINEVANVCEQMLNQPDELAAMGKRGIEAVRSKYNWTTEFEELLKCYNDLLNK